MHYLKHMLPLNLFHLFIVRSDHAYINKKYQGIIINQIYIKLTCEDQKYF